MAPDEQLRPTTSPRWRGATALALLIAATAAQYAWNAWSVPPLTGYDAPGHAGYALTIVREGRLPHPHEGWSTFHPPLYYLSAAALWRALEPLGPAALSLGLRGLGGLAWLIAGVVAFRALVRLGVGFGSAWVAAALLWFVPCNQLSAVMVGNETLGAALAAFAIPFALRLQADPGDRRAALFAGLLAGGALATKFSGLWVAASCALPFARRSLDGRALRALATYALAAAIVAGPVYARNLAVTGTPLPMTRDLEPMKSSEAALALRPRRLDDYLRFDPEVFLRPSVYHAAGSSGTWAGRNEAMTSVWSLVYAGLWYDAAGHRVPISQQRDGVWWGPLLLALGLVPTALVLGGLALATRDAVRSRGRSADAPLVLMTALGVAAFVGFTWNAPSLAAPKASYLLPLAVPAAVFFGRGATSLRPRARRAALALSLGAALASGAIFTHGLVFRSDLQRILIPTWLTVGRQLPGAHIEEAVRILYGLDAAGAPPATVER